MLFLNVNFERTKLFYTKPELLTLNIHFHSFPFIFHYSFISEQIMRYNFNEWIIENELKCMEINFKSLEPWPKL